MSILVRYHPEGLTRAQYDDVTRQVEGSWPPDGLELHVLFGDEGDLRVSEVWESEDRWRAFGDEILPALREAGVQMGSDPEVLQVHELQKP